MARVVYRFNGVDQYATLPDWQCYGNEAIYSDVTYGAENDQGFVLGATRPVTEFGRVGASYHDGPIWDFRFPDDSPIQDTYVCFGDDTRNIQLDVGFVLANSYEMSFDIIMSTADESHRWTSSATGKSRCGSTAFGTQLYFKGEGDGNFIGFDIPTPIADGQHAHVKFVVINDVVNAYVDGVQATTVDQPSPFEYHINQLCGGSGFGLNPGHAVQNIVIRDTDPVGINLYSADTEIALEFAGLPLGELVAQDNDGFTIGTSVVGLNVSGFFYRDVGIKPGYRLRATLNAASTVASGNPALTTQIGLGSTLSSWPIAKGETVNIVIPADGADNIAFVAADSGDTPGNLAIWEDVAIWDTAGNLVWEYKLDEGEGADVFNTGFNTQGNYNNEPLWGRYVLEGNSNRYIQIPTVYMAPTDAKRIKFSWVRADSPGGGGSIRAMGSNDNSGNNDRILLYDTDASTPNRISWFREGSARNFSNALEDVAIGQHCDIELIDDGSRVKAYVDGVLKGDVSSSALEWKCDQLYRSWTTNPMPPGAAMGDVILENLSTGYYIKYRIDEGEGTVVKAYDRADDEIIGGPELSPDVGFDDPNVWTTFGDTEVADGVLTLRSTAQNAEAVLVERLDATEGNYIEVEYEVIESENEGSLQVAAGGDTWWFLPSIEVGRHTAVIAQNDANLGDTYRFRLSGFPVGTVKLSYASVRKVYTGTITPDVDWVFKPEHSHNGQWVPNADWTFIPDNSRRYPMGEQTGTEFRCFDGNGVEQESLKATIVNPGSSGGGWDILPPGGSGSGPGDTMNDKLFEWLVAGGYVGALPDMRYKFFLDEGISTWRDYYNARGGTGQLNDWLLQFILDNPAGPPP